MQFEAEESYKLTMLDPLTGLYTRQFLEQHLATELARSQRHGYPMNVLMVDLNNFKQINDHYSRPTGDAVLKEFAGHLKSSIRSSDLAVRMGADEFLVLFTESSLERVPHMVARLDGLEVDFEGEKIPITFAAGWAGYRSGERADQLLERVEQELLTDKRTGRGKEAIQQAQAEVSQTRNIEALERLAGKVAHDFNHLLGLIKGYSELALDQIGASDPLREYIEQIQQANERANSLARQLLAFRRHAQAPELLDLSAVATGMQTMLRRVIGDQIELVIKPGDALGQVKGVRGQIEQVVLNLALNARDTMQDGGKLTLETANVELDGEFAQQHTGARPGSYVMLAAHDTGYGMDAETLAHIFEPFFLGREKTKGAGLGLAAVYGAVKQSGGYTWADSELGQGTTFTIYFPRADKTVEVKGEPKAPLQQRSAFRA